MILSRRNAFLAAAAFGASACGSRRSSRGSSVTVRFWHSLGGRGREVLGDMIARFHAAQSDVRVEAVHQGDYFESLAKLRTAMAARAAPALSHVVGEVVPYLSEAGVLEPLDKYESLSRVGWVPSLSQAGAFAHAQNVPLYAIALNRSTPLMYCNGDLLDKFGLSPPTTWDELRVVAQRLTDRDKRWGFVTPMSWWFWVALVGQAGGNILEPGGAPSLGGAAGVEALRFLQDLVHRERVMRPPAGRDYDAWNMTNQDFLSGRAAIVWTSTAYLRYLEDNARFAVVAAPLPKGRVHAVPTGGTFFVIPRQAPAEEKAAAARFVEFFCAPEQAAYVASNTGYLPVTREAVEWLERRGFYQSHKNDRVAQAQLSCVLPWPWHRQLFRISRDIIDPCLEDAILKDRNPESVLAEARVKAARPG